MMTEVLLRDLLVDRISNIDMKIDNIQEKVGETRECLAEMKERMDIYLGDGRDGEFQQLQNTVKLHNKIITQGGVYAGIIAAIVSFVVTFVIATHDHWLPHAKSNPAAIVQTK